MRLDHLVEDLRIEGARHPTVAAAPVDRLRLEVDAAEDLLEGTGSSASASSTTPHCELTERGAGTASTSRPASRAARSARITRWTVPKTRRRSLFDSLISLSNFSFDQNATRLASPLNLGGWAAIQNS